MNPPQPRVQKTGFGCTIHPKSFVFLAGHPDAIHLLRFAEPILHPAALPPCTTACLGTFLGNAFYRFAFIAAFIFIQ